MGAHPKAPSHILVVDKTIPLNVAIDKVPQFFLGEKLIKQLGAQLPFLLKVLSSTEPLSIQVHPDKTAARQLHQSDPSNYPDENHKPEIAYVLDELECLAGLRPVPEILQLLRTEAELQPIFPDFRQWERLPEEIILNRFWQACLNKYESEPLVIDQQLKALLKRLAERDQPGDPNLGLLPILARQHTRPDFGLLLSLFLKSMKLKTGEVLYLPPGCLHAYIRGNIIECMANSDNVVRAGLTSKFIDFSALKLVVNPLAQPQLLQPAKTGESQLYKIPQPDFVLERLELYPFSEQEINCQYGKVLFIWEGEIVLKWQGNEDHFGAGESIVLPAALSRVRVETAKPAVIFMVTAGIL